MSTNENEKTKMSKTFQTFVIIILLSITILLGINIYKQFFSNDNNNTNNNDNNTQNNSIGVYEYKADATYSFELELISNNRFILRAIENKDSYQVFSGTFYVYNDEITFIYIIGNDLNITNKDVPAVREITDIGEITNKNISVNFSIFSLYSNITFSKKTT